ncbi:hypothetical protein U6A24_13645 [Aquimarina gracilis]|uniref:LysM domain-containing protein n=1 Tax=Aquimarina gracilis TaxID=874422 RepID=A0ABU5ZXB8_9FLAO|nr:hypothetical protein [Aquimarina gracilis]MEB3346516.1 hypothetical protein [Aquimarina gracilis]
MESVTIQHNQSLLDIGLQEYGTPEAIFELALQNGLSVTDELSVTQEIELPRIKKIDLQRLSYYKRNNVEPATSYNGDLEIDCEGIGCMVVGYDFIISDDSSINPVDIGEGGINFDEVDYDS